MRTSLYIFQIIIITVVSIYLTSCKKEWLDRKPDQTVIVPIELTDFQALLDNAAICNNYPNLGELGSDNYFIAPGTILTQDELTINYYTWAANGWGGNNGIGSWTTSYKAIFYANTCLEGVKKVKQTAQNSSAWKNIYGTSLFVRGTSFYNLVNVFGKPYAKATANVDLGIPIRLETDPTLKSVRASVADVYEQALIDLKESEAYLPASTSFKIRPTKQAAYGMLARIYLSMGQYDSALVYAHKCLEVSSSLLPYQGLSTTPANSFPLVNTNPEIILYATMGTANALAQSRADIDSFLYRSYEADDLRFKVFFRKSGTRNVWAGSYTQVNTSQFAGLAIDEIYLIRAESYARLGRVSEAMQDLNTLLRSRWNANSFSDRVAANADIAVELILQERRKELLFRALRWADLKRLNHDSRFAKTITRLYNNKVFTLSPGDNKFAWPIPNDEILYSGIQQNER